MICLTIFALISALTVKVNAVQSLVDLGYAEYEGTGLANGVSQWLGIRFAAPPLGDLRFRAPADPLTNSTVILAKEHGSICLGTDTGYPVAGADEDCLFLDLYAPTAATASSLLPVYFFIQGGGFNANDNANYNGSGIILASEMNVIVITFNYRVGPFGFLASEEVAKNGDLNVGLLDQRKALQWVQQHVTKFGGNPNHVVIGGASAGATSLALHLTAYGGTTSGLFHGVIGESQFFNPELTVSQSQYQYTALIERVGCQSSPDTLACLRSTDLETLQTANIAIPYAGQTLNPLWMYGPVIDGDLVPDYLDRLFEQSKFAKVPTIFGDDTNEGSYFAPTNTSSVQDMSDFLQSQYPALTNNMLDEIQALYPKAEQFPNHGAYFSATSNAYTEITFICPGLLISSSANNAESSQIWNYHYNVTDPAQAAEGLGVPHTIEISAIWGPDNTNGAAPASYYTTNAAIIPVIQGYWISFIRTLNPNALRAPGTPEWNTFGPHQERLLFMTNSTRMELVQEEQKARCSYLTSIGLQIEQ